MAELNEYLAQLSDRKFFFLQMVVGLLSAVLGGCCILFLGNSETEFNSFGLAGALIICGGLPTLLRSKIERPTPWIRWFIIIGLVVMLGIYVALRFL